MFASRDIDFTLLFSLFHLTRAIARARVRTRVGRIMRAKDRTRETPIS